jgi:membrane protein implicated in regulation of membrane protease activity
MDITLAYAEWIWIFLVLLFAFISLFVLARAFRALSVGAAIAALVAFFGAALIWQLLIFIAVAALLLSIAALAAPRKSDTHETVYGVDRVVGKEAVVVVAIDPKTAQGRVRVERETWPADSESGQPIPDGSTVQVLALRGERVLVRPLPVEA